MKINSYMNHRPPPLQMFLNIKKKNNFSVLACHELFFITFKKCFYFSRRSVSSSDEDESQDGFDLTESERGMKLKTYIVDS